MPSRYVCNVLEEMRSMYKSRNFAGFLGLVEEVQTLVNRMESALEEQSDYNHWHKKVQAEKAEYKKLVEKANRLRKKQGKKLVDPDQKW